MAVTTEHNRIAILDSDKKTVSILIENLVQEGYSVDHIKEPSRLLEIVKNDQSDVVILAVDIKGVKAYNLIPVLKKLNRCMPVIVVSNDDSVEVASRVREQGVFFYAIKPLDVKETKLVVKNALNRKIKCINESSWGEKRGLKEEGLDQQVLDLNSASEILSVSKKTITELAEQGEIPANKIGKEWYFLRNQLFDWFRVTAGGNQRNYGTLILETMDEGVAVVDRELKIVSCNSAYLKSVDIPRDRIIGEYCYKVSRRSPVPCSEATCPAQQAFKTLKAVKLMHVSFDEGGKPHYCDLVALPMQDEHGNVPQVVEIIRDNTEIYDLNRHLNWVIGFVAHELKGTLGSIMMNISALADEKISRNIGDVRRNEMLISSLSSMKLMHDMIRNYLISSKANSGQLPLERKPVDFMKEVVKPIVDEMRPLLIKKRMNVELQACGENPVVCDRDLMRTVFSNLINNAIKYGTAGTDVRCEIVVNATALEVGVFNEGSGIPADKLVEVFGEFTRFDISGVGGTGLGLYVVKKLVDMHHGAVRAESGYMIDGEAVVYDDFYKNDKYFGLREKDGELKRFAKFVVRIPLSKAADPKDGSSNGSTSGNNQ